MEQRSHPSISNVGYVSTIDSSTHVGEQSSKLTFSTGIRVRRIHYSRTGKLFRAKHYYGGTIVNRTKSCW